MIEDKLLQDFYDYLSGLDIYENKNSLELARIVVKPEYKNKGIGTKIMEALVKYADENMKVISLTPASDFGSDKNRLLQFYKRFGFKLNKGYHKNFSTKNTMIRYPKLNENKQLIKNILNKKLMENIVIPPTIPNTRIFWHGGNLSEYSDVIAQKNGRYEFGAGLYLTTQYDIAKKYAKGSRKLYIVTVQLGNDIQDSFIDTQKAIEFVKNYALTGKRKEILYYIDKYNVDGKIKGYLFNNLLLNHKAIKPTYTKFLREFLIQNGVDYEIVNNAFGFGEDMMVLYNMKKIVQTTVFGTKDRMEDYNFETR